MELIPIIKYALTGISGISFVTITISYILYKVKNGNNSPQAEMSAASVNINENHFIPENHQVAAPQPVRTQSAPAAYVQERNFHHNRVPVRKPSQRFMVLNEQIETVKEDLTKKSSNNNNNFNFVHPYTNQNFNIYSNYSANTSERLEKFGI